MSGPGRGEESARKRRCRGACRQCRQSKVKCGMEVAPCLRCLRMGIQCEWDPQFKRRRNQERFQNLEQEVSMLRRSRMATVSSSENASATLTHTGDGDDDLHTSLNLRLEQSTEIVADVSVTGLGSRYGNTTHLTAGNIKLSVEAASGLFVGYFDRYHKHVPFLDPKRTLEDVHRSSDVLFWAMMSVAAREQQPEPDFLPRLSRYLSESLGGIVIGGIMSLGHIQALLLLSLWPPSDVTLYGDRSMTLANLAVTGALFLGLHHPHYQEEYSNGAVAPSPNDRGERARTWIACLSVAQNLAMDSGLPLRLPFASAKVEDMSVMTPVRGVPIDLHHYHIIQQHAYAAFANLPDCGNAAASPMTDGTLLNQLYEADNGLRDLLDTRLTNMSLLNRLRCATVQLHLRSMYFHVCTASPQRQRGVLSAYETATAIIDTLMSEDGGDEILSHSPRTTFRALLLAACVICKVLHSGYGSDIDFRSGRILFNAGLICIRKQAVRHSSEKKDTTLRCVDFMREVWHLSENSPSLTTSQPELVVQTRLGASVLYHFVAVFFDRLALSRRRESQGGPGVSSPSSPDHMGLLSAPDVDPRLTFANLGLDLTWGSGLTPYELHGFF